MLEREHRRGRKHRDLLVVVDGLESRPHGNFGFSIAHVSAKQPVHRLRRFHVALHIADRLRLVFSFVVLKSAFKLAHPFIVSRETMTLSCAPLRIQLQQFLSHVLHGLAHAGFRLRPGCAAEMIEDRLDAFR